MNIIVTLNGYNNYGNRLQLFALTNILRRIDKDEVSVYWPKSIKLKIKELCSFSHFSPVYSQKMVKIKNFSEKYTAAITRHVHRNSKVIVGSDQVWNPDYFNDCRYLLNIKSTHKISYAASVGKKYLSTEQRTVFESALKDYKSISVREQSARELLQPLTDKKIEVVLDPTLLLDKEEYEKMEAKPKDIEEKDKYILCYILGGHEQISKIEEYASEHNYKIIMFSDKKDSSYGVEEFLYLIHHAQIVCTDSFHACVFSFIFERPFIAFKRTGEANYMYTRLKNLIDTFKLKNREFNGIEITNENANVDYSEAKKILKVEQEKSIGFLKKALEADNEK